MKNTKLFQILTLVLSLAVLTVGFCFVASAADEPSVSIIAKNVSYDDVVKVMFAVDNTNAGENEVELLYYVEDPTVNPSAVAYKGEVYDKGYTDDNGVNYPAFFSAGFPAKHLGDKVYARAHIVGTEIYSDVARYSVVEYLLERLYVDMATGDKKALYQDLLSYGASAQRVLINGNDDPADDVTNFITDYVLVAIEGGTLDGKYSQGIYFPGVDKVYPQADGVATWNATVFDLTTGAGTTTEVSGGAVYDVTGFTMFTPASQGEAPSPAYKPDLTDTAGRINWSDYSTATEYKDTAKLIDYWFPSGTDPQLVEGAPYGVNSMVAKLTTAVASGQDQFYVKTTSKSANATMYIFETDVMIDPDVNSVYEITFRNGSNVAYTAFVYAEVEGAVTIYGKVKSDNNTAPISSVTADGLVGNWFRFRMEYIDVTSTTAKIRFYCNEGLIGESEEFTKTYAASDLTQIIIAANSTADGDMYIDNTKAEQYTPPYVPDMSDLASRETYEDGDALDTFKFDNGATTEIVNDAPYGEASKVYKYIKDNNTGTNEINIKPTSKPSGTNTFFFESDVKFVASGAATIEIQIRGNSSVGTGYTLYLSATGDGDVVIKNNSNVAIATIAKTGEWFRLGIGYGTTAEGSGVIIYVNGEQINESPLAASKNVADFDRIRFVGHTASVFEFYLDNTKAQYLVK